MKQNVVIHGSFVNEILGKTIKFIDSVQSRIEISKKEQFIVK